MTLNANHIRELLEQATPGTWKLDPKTDGIKNSAGNSVVRGDAYCGGDEVWLEWRFDADPALAALAPELAADWHRA